MWAGIVEHLDWIRAFKFRSSQNMAAQLSSLNPAPFIYKEVTTQLILWDSQINNINHNTYSTLLIASDFCSNKHPCSWSTSWFIQARPVLVYSFAPHCSEPLHIKFSFSPCFWLCAYPVCSTSWTSSNCQFLCWETPVPSILAWGLFLVRIFLILKFKLNLT